MKHENSSEVVKTTPEKVAHYLRSIVDLSSGEKRSVAVERIAVDETGLITVIRDQTQAGECFVIDASQD